MSGTMLLTIFIWALIVGATAFLFLSVRALKGQADRSKKVERQLHALFAGEKHATRDEVDTILATLPVSQYRGSVREAAQRALREARRTNGTTGPGQAPAALLVASEDITPQDATPSARVRIVSVEDLREELEAATPQHPLIVGDALVGDWTIAFEELHPDSTPPIELGRIGVGWGVLSNDGVTVGIVTNVVQGFLIVNPTTSGRQVKVATEAVTGIDMERRNVTIHVSEEYFNNVMRQEGGLA
jgi:hypothetical protein